MYQFNVKRTIMKALLYVREKVEFSRPPLCTVGKPTDTINNSFPQNRTSAAVSCSDRREFVRRARQPRENAVETIPEGDRSDEKRLPSNETSDISGSIVFDRNNDSVRFAAGFLEKLCFLKLKERLLTMADKGKIRGFMKPRSADGSVSPNKGFNRKAAGWSIVDRLLEREGLPPPVRDRFRKGFEKCCNDSNSFVPTESDPGLVLAALAIEGNGMEFHPKAFKETLDFSELEYYEKTYQETIRDIKRIYRDIVLYERGIKEKRSEAKINKIPKPELRYEIVVEYLSDHLLPVSMISETGGVYTISINRNFVLFMHELRGSGLGGPGGDIYEGPTFEPIYEDDEPHEAPAPQIRLGNLYESILYAVAINDIRGNFIFENGSVILNMDRNRVQREWGRTYRFVNTVAISYFWLAMVQGMTRFDYPEAENFIRKNPGFFCGLENKHQDILLEILGKLSISMTFNFDVDTPEIISRVPIPTPAALFLLLRDGGMTSGEIARRLKWSDLDMFMHAITRKLLELIDYGVIKATKVKSKVVGLSEFKQHFRANKERVFYERLPMPEKHRNKVQGILDELEQSVGPSGFAKAKAKIKINRLFEPDRIKAAAGRSAAQKVRKAAGKPGLVRVIPTY